MDEPQKPKRGAQWANSYEAQLTDEELRKLHSAIRAREPSDTELRENLPLWRYGSRKGEQVSLSTLSHIRERLEMEDAMAEDAATTQSLVEEAKRDDPGLTDEQLQDLGNRTFTLLAIRRRDDKAYVRVVSAKNKAELEREKLKIRQQEADRGKAVLELEREKFREAVRTKIDAGLDELAEQIGTNPEARELYQKFRALVKKATE
jgi:hypothetical protein